MSRIVILQEYIPEYRRAFFALLRDKLSASGVELQLAAGSPFGAVAARGDATTDVADIDLPARRLTMGSRTLVVRRIASAVAGSDLIIAEQALRHLETYRLLWRAHRGGTPVGLWGHGRTYVKPRTIVESRIERWLTNEAHWFFAYTRGGACEVVRNGFPADRITVVQNSIDTAELSRARSAITEALIAQTRHNLELPGMNVAFFVGSLDESKRLDFLVAAGRKIAAVIPDFTLIIAGDGPLRDAVVDEYDSGAPVRLVGRASAKEKALYGALSKVLLMPGRVGLAAVDAFALGLPIVTTDWGQHAPEFEYLANGVNSVVTRNDVDSYVDAVVALLRDAKRLERLAATATHAASDFSLDAMADRFGDGVVQALASDQRHVR